MRITCPVCGPRSVAEFAYGGDATVARPALDAPAADWNDAVYARRNPKGAHREHWQHVGGCRAWLEVERDTASHAIAAVRLIGPWTDDFRGGGEGGRQG